MQRNTAQSLALAADQLVGNITGLFKLTKRESLTASQIHFWDKILQLMQIDPFVGHMHATEFFSNNTPPSFSSSWTHRKAACETVPELLQEWKAHQKVQTPEERWEETESGRQEEQAMFTTVGSKRIYQVILWAKNTSQNVNPNLKTRKQ